MYYISEVVVTAVLTILFTSGTSSTSEVEVTAVFTSGTSSDSANGITSSIKTANVYLSKIK